MLMVMRVLQKKTAVQTGTYFGVRGSSNACHPLWLRTPT
jgi:hypothetical protein